MRIVRLNWEGPFLWCSATRQSFFDRPEAQLRGLYLWGIKRPGGYLVAGFGITRVTFASRFVFHTRSYLDGRYAVYHLSLLKTGKRKDVWPGFWWDTEAWENPTPHLRQLSSIGHHAASLLQAFRIFVASVTPRPRVLERIEARIYKYLRADPDRAGLLVEEGMRVSERRPRERPFQVKMVAPAPFLGLPLTFNA